MCAYTRGYLIDTICECTLFVINKTSNSHLESQFRPTKKEKGETVVRRGSLRRQFCHRIHQWAHGNFCKVSKPKWWVTSGRINHALAFKSSERKENRSTVKCGCVRCRSMDANFMISFFWKCTVDEVLAISLQNMYINFSTFAFIRLHHRLVIHFTGSAVAAFGDKRVCKLSSPKSVSLVTAHKETERMPLCENASAMLASHNWSKTLAKTFCRKTI